jgi:pimeloyl-ACP methyl ester carboxylesterase
MRIDSLLFGKLKVPEQENFLATRAPIRSIPAHLHDIVRRKTRNNHIYLEAGEGRPVIFCHGLFGGIFNIDAVCRELSRDYRFIMPYLPMYDMALGNCTVKKLGDYLEQFINEIVEEKAVVIGNSMGGGAAIHYAGKTGHRLNGLVLCGSSGLSTIPLSKGFFKRKNYEFVRESVRDIFMDRSVPTEEMVDDVYQAIQDNETVLRSIRYTKSATSQTVHAILPKIDIPTLLVWGGQDPITPVEVAPEFERLIPNSSLHIIQGCGHVPQQEKPYQFLEYLYYFLKKINY